MTDHLESKNKKNKKEKEKQIIHCLIWEVPGANFYFVFLHGDLLSPWGFGLTQRPKDHYNHDA